MRWTVIVISNSQIKRILVSTLEDEILLAVLEGQQLVELHFEEIDSESITGNIFLSRVENVVNSLDAVFVNIGTSKNAFLRNKDIVKKAYLQQLGGKATDAHRSGAIDSLSKGQKLIVQVKKDPIGSKGPQVTTNIGLTGRFLVYMPYSTTVGVSKKIEDPEERKRLHDFMGGCIHDEGIIIRTVSKDITLATLEEELHTLRVKWQEVLKGFQRFKKPRVLFSEPDILEQLMREKYDTTVDEVITNSKEVYSRLQEILNHFDKKYVKGKLRYCPDDILELYNVNKQMDDLVKRRIELSCGGSLVIDRTEALTVIDVNSGSNQSNGKSRDMVLETNVQAAKEIARQVRLRNLSGIIIGDFIDMENENDQMTILKVLEEELKKDKAKTSVMGFTKLGLVEMARKRTSPPLGELIHETCPVCKGEGMVFSPKRIVKRMERELEVAAKMKDVKEVLFTVHWNLSGYLSKEWRERSEAAYGKHLVLEFSRQDPNGYDVRYKKE
ncbi:MAG TPA: Rne/Rng family ribonuclease [Thermotogota bacterium]|jgi:ribonuclease G|nr:Rne/Rng family ribonuclease [Thermotogota bacterium]NLH19367.1 Rne/Rng family ribonuclease [Thermotogaceae bacterium]OQC32832.1 MAG: Ribonuclease G [Thermotogota bacterium ADurb.Bin062]HNW46354.1 Rne/Rng family ribonuclease [Thermotogota bacterium]HNY82147.1 Rne/Rng family ribonuclease [Thermotogota bacterium]